MSHVLSTALLAQGFNWMTALMLESLALVPHVLKELSDCKAALAPQGVWRFASEMSGGQSVKTRGQHLMPELCVFN